MSCAICSQFNGWTVGWHDALAFYGSAPAGMVRVRKPCRRRSRLAGSYPAFPLTELYQEMDLLAQETPKGADRLFATSL